MSKELEEKETKKPCSQKQINKSSSRIVFNPFLLFIFCTSVFSATFLLYAQSLMELNYEKTYDIVYLVVRTDGFVLAFSGVIVSVILRREVTGEQILKAQTFKTYRETRTRITYFIFFTVLSLIGSIFFGIGALLTQFFPLAVYGSLVLMFVGVIELFTMIIYTLESQPETTGNINV